MRCSIVGHFSPPVDDTTELADGDLVKMCAVDRIEPLFIPAQGC